MVTRLRRAKDKEIIFQALTDGSDEAPFNKLKDVFLFAACLGFLEEKADEFSNVGGQIPWTVFNDDADQAIVDALAYGDTDDLTCLLDSEEKRKKKFNIVEQYANGGMTILKKKLLDSPGRPLDNLVNLILEFEGTESREVDDISKFAEDLF